MTQTQHYRGIIPLMGVKVLEGDGDARPYQEVIYVLAEGSPIEGKKLATLGKLVPLTEEERKWLY